LVDRDRVLGTSSSGGQGQSAGDKFESGKKYVHFEGNLVQNGIFAYSFVLPF
jgi:hypothetical protein